MAIIRVKKNKNYTVMSNYHFRDKRLSLKTIGLLSLMLSLPDDWDFSVLGLTKIVKESHNTVATALNELEKYGYLERSQSTEKGKFSKSEYIIFEKPCTKKPCTEKPCTKKPCTENWSQVSTKEESTKEESTKRVESTLSQQEYDSLVNEYGKTLVDEKIDNAKNYKNCMKYEKLREWCELDKNKKKAAVKKGPDNNRFNNFHQREYTKEEMDELTKAFFAN